MLKRSWSAAGELAMSAQFGIWDCDFEPVEPSLLEEAATLLSPYGPDGRTAYSRANIGIVSSAFHTTKEAHREIQPLTSRSGAVVAWNGRLDNREELAHALPELSSSDSTDVTIVAAVFERWGTPAFAKLTGDWAVSVFKPLDGMLYLATDYIGICRLYYSIAQKRVFWCTHLEPLVRLSRTSLTVDDEYVAAYLAHYPPAHLTPYREIQAVPPGGSVAISDGNVSIRRHWTFEQQRPIRYKSDQEYEAHFRHLFSQAVRRRLRSNSPILAELSGGLDSSSIVCAADDLIGRGEAEPPQLDTISYYDPAVSAGDERSYISRVEERRGRNGHHIDTSQYGCSLSLGSDDFVAVPGTQTRPRGIRAVVHELMQHKGYRVVLSGIGGDEFLGGIPNPLPQLADLIILGRPIALARGLAAWSLIKKVPWLHLLRDATLLVLPAAVRPTFAGEAAVAPWIDANFARQHCLRIRQLGPQGRYGLWRPSRQDQAQTLIAMRRQMAFSSAYDAGPEDRRYPFLDQNLVEFLLSIPVTQLLRPGERRSLMRRALAGIVPPEIMSRRTKGSVARSTLACMEVHWAEVEALVASPLSAARGYVDRDGLQWALQKLKNGDAPQLVGLIKTLQLEQWLRGLEKRRISSAPLEQTELLATARQRPEPLTTHQ
jgi:asparagine synthase (glutamine-hydrolysing)